ncbi:hypothetical protein [Antrihabitans sp. YC2-6]|uniref:hypothetical protein n=1 Tax=Antrihabitans sp. YC2-6 TaxID=2799498 RepID=UPI0018F5C693|nr:hypothetical protein [Antrihabitans sp. YC2-6]MBJ8344704.1 hypothetical protein [Antrihabitans sp. YC2-6]
MQELSCTSCGNRVLVDKYSPTHTSIQWLTDAEKSCPRFAAQVEAGVRSMWIPTCPALRESIDRAAGNGALRTDALRSEPIPGRLG